MGMSMYYKSPFYETPDIPDCISPPLLEAITRLQPQLCGFNANLLSKKSKKNKQGKTTATAAKIREGKVYSAFERPGHWSYICIPRMADCSSGPCNGGCLHENLFLILAPFEANSGGPVQQSVMLLELTNVFFQS